MKQYQHKFVVEPNGGSFQFQFPIDMLRYDHCYPGSEEDSSKILDTFQRRGSGGRKEITIKKTANKAWVPTAGRWESFGWVVKEHSMR